MSDIAERVAAAEQTRSKPTLRLVNHKWSSIVLVILSSAFGDAERYLESDRLHARVNSYLRELVEAGVDVPGTDAQGLCRAWTKEQWLERVPRDSGGEAYSLTSHALAAQQIVERMSRGRHHVSASRLTTIVSAVQRAARLATVDVAARKESLRRDISRLGVELAELEAGHVVDAASAGEMLTAYRDIADLLAQLPEDFRRVEEEIDQMHRTMIREFRADSRPKGEVLDEYLRRSEHLMQSTEAGRAVEGALTMLSDPELLAEFRSGLRAILTHEFADSLDAAERRLFADAASRLRMGARQTQESQARASRSLADYLASHDSTAEREVSATLRSLQDELDVWMNGARPRDYVPLEWLPKPLNIEHLRTRLFNPASEQPAAALDDVTDGAPERLDLAEIRPFGGPHSAKVWDRVMTQLRAGTASSVAEAFNALDAQYRRPVEVLALADALTQSTELEGSARGDLDVAQEWGFVGALADESDVFATVRPDGSTRLWRVLASTTPRGSTADQASAEDSPAEATWAGDDIRNVVRNDSTTEEWGSERQFDE